MFLWIYAKLVNTCKMYVIYVFIYMYLYICIYIYIHIISIINLYIQREREREREREKEIARSMALLEYKKRILKKLTRAQLTYHNLKALSQSDSLLVDILSSLLKYEGKVPNLTFNIQITNTSTADNVCT